MITLDELAHDEQICEEYKKTLLLTMFKKICFHMQSDAVYRMKIVNLYKQSPKWDITVQSLVEREFSCKLSVDEARLMSGWLIANFRKKPNRKSLSLELKKELYRNQGGRCKACGEPLGDNMSKIHIDHIIPWILVGDELEDNYQDLCEACNECKNSRVDYLLLKKLKIN